MDELRSEPFHKILKRNSLHTRMADQPPETQRARARAVTPRIFDGQGLFVANQS